MKSWWCAGILGMAAACATSPTTPQTKPLDPKVLVAWKQGYVQFSAALMKLHSADPAERVRGLEEAASLTPFFIWEDDQALIQAARGGDGTAAAELARRADVYDAIQTFWKPYDKVRWEAARKRIVSRGEDAAGYLSMIFVGYLLQEKFRNSWPNIRYELVEIGEEARKTVAGVLAEKIRISEDLPIGRWDEVTQLAATVLAFGERGMADFRAAAASPKRYVRASVIRAVVESRALDQIPVVARILLEDPQWEVRAAAATALGDLRAREKSCRPLLEAFRRERDDLVRDKVIIALGRAGCAEAVPLLMNALDVPGIAGRVMEALYDITGERLNTRERWARWYEEKYPAWKAKRPP